MKIKVAKTAYCGYIYADGHVVILHRERHPKAGEVEWVEIFEKIDTHCAFEGRIVFHNLGYERKFRLACEAYTLRATVPSVSNGSDNTKKLGIAVGNFAIEFKDGADLLWSTMPGVLSDGITYQPDVNEAFNPEWDNWTIWGRSRVGKIHRLSKAEVANPAAPELVAA